MEHLPIEVESNDAGKPAAVHWRGVRYEVTARDLWQLMPKWWAYEPMNREYYMVDSDHLHCVVFRDMEMDTWHMAREYL